jgi:hypothetical protein
MHIHISNEAQVYMYMYMYMYEPIYFIMSINSYIYI